MIRMSDVAMNSIKDDEEDTSDVTDNDDDEKKMKMNDKKMPQPPVTLCVALWIPTVLR